MLLIVGFVKGIITPTILDTADKLNLREKRKTRPAPGVFLEEVYSKVQT